MDTMIECRVEKLVFGGMALGRYQGKVVMIQNALPGELVQARVIKEKKDYIEAYASLILAPSPERITPQEDHFMSCSPWQILNQDAENQWKQRITAENFDRAWNKTGDVPALVTDHCRFHYRNKVEFHFAENKGQLSLALIQRNSNERLAVKDCALLSSPLNQVGTLLRNILEQQQISASSLDRLTLRCNRKEQVIFALGVHSKGFPKIDFLKLCPRVSGFVVFQEEKRHGKSVQKVLHQAGKLGLEEELCGKTLEYGVHSFFQVNMNVLEKTLEDLLPFVKGESVVDYYGGTGTLSIALSEVISDAVIVESNPEAWQYAKHNIERNRLAHFYVASGKTENFLNYIKASKVVIVDPPRAGLHPQVLEQLLALKPKRVIYLSCNLSTCIRDLKRLMTAYQLVYQKIYNFFPATPHFEFLAILQR
ncbi:23S rRNA (uracil(1939)-C(5))-methyltransferase RlmD [Deltaproteobacteria bacterium TL4]